MQKLEVSVSGETKELIVRTGEALPEERPNPVSISGNIYSPALFAEKRKAEIEPKTTNVFVSKRNLTITLVTQEQTDRGFTIKGGLVLNRHLHDLKINTEAGFDKKSLQKALKFRRTLFSTIENYQALMGALEAFTVKSQTEVNDHDNRRGNVNQQFKRESQLEVPLNFNLRLPVYEGTEPKSFMVEILADVRDSGVSFYLESVELADLLETVRDEVFAEELAKLSDYVIITE